MLTEREKRFVEALGAGCSGAEAARRAGYSGSAHDLAAYASRLRRKPHIAAELEQRLGLAMGRPSAAPALPADPQIADTVEQARLLTGIARDRKAAGKDRIRAVVALAAITKRAPPPAAPAPTPRSLFRVTHDDMPRDPSKEN